MTTLVVAGTGTTGRRVLARLAARGVPARAGSRSTAPPFDWEDRRTWRLALEGVRSVYLVFAPDLAFPGAAPEVAALAEASGQRRLVMLSRRGEEGATEAEWALRASSAQWTIVRAGCLAQIFSEGFLRGPVAAGEVALPARPVGEPFVDAEDVADVVVAALTEDGHADAVYDVTGPRLLTFAEAVDEIARATGRGVGYIRVSMTDYVARLAERGTPIAQISLLRYLFTEVHDGRNAHRGFGVQHVLGREPRDFSEFARAAAASGAWDKTEVR